MEIQSYLQALALEAGISDLTSYDFAEVLDEVDPLKHLRQEFFYPKMKTLPKGIANFFKISISSKFLFFVCSFCKKK